MKLNMRKKNTRKIFRFKCYIFMRALFGYEQRFFEKRRKMKDLKIGRLVATARVDERMKADKDFKKFVYASFDAYIHYDWGSLCDEDKEFNKKAIENDERVLAEYIYPKTGEKIWIITEWDRSVTTVLFPDEY